MEACGDNPDIGYASNYVPKPSDPLDEEYDTALISGDDIDMIDSHFSVNCTLYLGEEPLSSWICSRRGVACLVAWSLCLASPVCLPCIHYKLTKRWSSSVSLSCTNFSSC